jgi:hypothetical protein
MAAMPAGSQGHQTVAATVAVESSRDHQVANWAITSSQLALSHGLDPALKPTKLDISETVRWLSYKPAYSVANLLSELAAFGDNGPPRFPEN